MPSRHPSCSRIWLADRSEPERNGFGPPTRFSGRPSAVATAETGFTPHTQLRRMDDWRNIAAVQSPHMPLTLRLREVRYEDHAIPSRDRSSWARSPDRRSLPRPGAQVWRLAHAQVAGGSAAGFRDPRKRDDLHHVAGHAVLQQPRAVRSAEAHAQRGHHCRRARRAIGSVHHAQTDAPYARGRLVITPLGEGRFTVEVTRGADKWAIRA
jgi:hypothetical protein